MTVFMRDAWYPAAWEREVGDAPLAVTLLAEAVAIFRRDDGTYAAVSDACPHRKQPLSAGRVCGDVIECGYHGLRFTGDGVCVAAPTNGGTIPAGAVVRAYPAVARYGLVWMWMGDPDRADPAAIFHVEHWGDPAWGTTDGDDMVVDCDYRFIVDNLLDPSHVAWVHPTSFSGQGADDTPMEVTIGEHGVAVWRWMLDVPAAPFYAPYLPFDGNCDRKQQYEMRYPCHALVQAVFVPAGAGGEGRPIPANAFLMDSYNFLTPIDATHTRYFWFQQRNVAPDDAEVSRQFAASVRAAFDEDKLVLGRQQAGIDAATTPTINLRSDVGGLRFRHRLSQLIESEQLVPR